MASPRASLTLFGLNLTAVLEYWRDAWREALAWPAFRWLNADVPVSLLAADGRWRRVAGGQIVSATSAQRPASRAVVGLLLNDDDVLVRELALPSLGQSDLVAAIEMEVRASSPFPSEDTVWGWRAKTGGAGNRQIMVALASRRRIMQSLATAAQHLPAGQAEVWAAAGGGICLRGFGEGRRERTVRRSRQRLLLLSGGNVILLLALLAAPVMQQRAELKQAQAVYARLNQDAREVLAAREQLSRAIDSVATLTRRQEAVPHTLVLLEALTRLLPDGAWLERLEFQGQVLRLQGWADNTTALMESFGSIPGVAEVRMPAPTSRDPQSGKERFTIELMLGAKAA